MCWGPGCRKVVPEVRLRFQMRQGVKRHFCSDVCSKKYDQNKVTERKRELKRKGLCQECSTPLDTPSPYKCRVCLDKNRDLQLARRRAKGAAKRSRMLCQECWEPGHNALGCPRRRRA